MFGAIMKKVSLDAWIQLMGMLGLVGGLVFVGLEMRQSQRIALADTEQQRAIAQQQNFWAFLEAGYDLDKVFRAENVNELSNDEIIARRTNHHIQWYIAESDFAQYRNGLMTDDVYEVKERNIERLMSHCDLQDITYFRLQYFAPDFLERIGKFANPCK
ncbi:MAG TPA: hypothetical protein DIT65_06370 [Cryomorphaceae bacterium]|nr:hypothetical protein [Cryomorphaceae bacterium]